MVIGKNIKTDCFSDAWASDFNSKSEILKNNYQESLQEDLYIDLFGSLESKCNLLLSGNIKQNNKKFGTLSDYVANNDTVFIYPQVFDNFCKGKYYQRNLDSLNALKCFVVDIDDVTSSNISYVIDKIDKMKLKPNYVVNSGNGLHLYFVFSALHYVKASIGNMMFVENKSTPNQCLTYNVIYSKNYYKYLDIYKKIKKGIINWFSDLPMKADTNNHLVQPIRLFGSKTKNPKYFTEIFKITDVKYSIQDVAELFDIELPDEENIKELEVFSKKIQNQLNYQKVKEKNNKDNKKKLESITSSTGDITTQRYKIDYTDFIEKCRKEQEEYLNSEEYIREQKYYQKVKEERGKKKSKKNTLTAAQAKGFESQYNQFKNLIWNAGKIGNRRNCLYVFWNRAHQYTKDKNLILKDYKDIANYFQSLSLENLLTDSQINEIPNQKVIKLKNETIFKFTGINIVFERKRDVIRENTKIQTKIKKENELKAIIDLSKKYFSDNPNSGYRELSIELESFGIKKSFKTLSKISQIKDIRNNFKSN